MSAIQISALSKPKSVRYVCEICGEVATVMCSECPTYYCSFEHFDVDWRGIRNLIAQDIVVLREKPRNIGSEEERARREEEFMTIRKELRELCTETAQKFLVQVGMERGLVESHQIEVCPCYFLFQGKYDLAVPGALQSLKFSVEIHGSEATELVPSYLLLAEANLGLRRLKVAEEFLSLANWNLIKNAQQDSNKLNSSLQRNFGRLYSAQQRPKEALAAFATDIYYNSQEYGPESIKTSPSYFHLARVFESHEKMEKADSFYDKVLEIMIVWLVQHLPFVDSTPLLPPAYLPGQKIEDVEELTPVELEECFEIVKHISSFRESSSAPSSSLGATRLALALLYLFSRNEESAEQVEGLLREAGTQLENGGALVQHFKKICGTVTESLDKRDIRSAE